MAHIRTWRTYEWVIVYEHEISELHLMSVHRVYGVRTPWLIPQAHTATGTHDFQISRVRTPWLIRVYGVGHECLITSHIRRNYISSPYILCNSIWITFHVCISCVPVAVYGVRHECLITSHIRRNYISSPYILCSSIWITFHVRTSCVPVAVYGVRHECLCCHAAVPVLWLNMVCGMSACGCVLTCDAI